MSLNEVNFSTERLILRGIKLSDAKSMLKYRSNPKIYEFQYWKPKTLHEVEDFILTSISKALNIPNTWYQVGIFIKEFSELAGDIGIHFIELDNLEVEIGYTLSLDYQGRGYAGEAVVSVINYLFNDLNKHRIIASVDPENITRDCPFKKSMSILQFFHSFLLLLDRLTYGVVRGAKHFNC